MRALLFLGLAVLVLPATALPPQAGFPVPGEFFVVGDRPAFLALSAKPPVGHPGPWVLFAPSLPNSPNHHEEWLLRLERQHFVELAQMPQTQDRIAHMLKTGKPLRN